MAKKKTRAFIEGFGFYLPETKDHTQSVKGPNPVSESGLPDYLDNPKIPFYSQSVYTFNGLHTDRPLSPTHWMHGDNQELFEKNKKRMGTKWKYYDKTVTYTFNEHGYRCPEWDQIDWKNSIVLFGCSCTYGLGLSDEETISAHLEKLSNRPVINLGVPGGSNSLMIQNATNLLHFFEAPYAVANIWSTSDRFEYFLKDKIHRAGPWDGMSKSVGNVQKLWQYTYEYPEHEQGLNYYETKIGKWLWQDRSKYSAISFFPSIVTFTQLEKHFVMDHEARDLDHPGENNAIEVANYLHERFK